MHSGLRRCPPAQSMAAGQLARAGGNGVDAGRVDDVSLRADRQPVDGDVLPRGSRVLDLIRLVAPDVARPVVHRQIGEAVARRRRPLVVRARKLRTGREARNGQRQRRNRQVRVADASGRERAVPVAVGRQQVEVRLALAGARIERVGGAGQTGARVREVLADPVHRVRQRRAVVRRRRVELGEPGRRVRGVEILDVEKTRRAAAVLPKRVVARAQLVGADVVRERAAAGGLHRQHAGPVERVELGEILVLLRHSGVARPRGVGARPRRCYETAGGRDIDALEYGRRRIQCRHSHSRRSGHTWWRRSPGACRSRTCPIGRSPSSRTTRW